MNNIKNIIFILCISMISVDVYCLNKNNDLSEILDLESDDNGNNPNQSIPELGGQMPSSPNAFDDEANRKIIRNDDGTADDLDVSLLSYHQVLEHDNPPMHINNLDRVQALIHIGININEKNSLGNTLLHNAVFFHNINSNNIPFVQTLIAAGADPTIKNNDGKIPADLTQDPEMLKILNAKLQ